MPDLLFLFYFLLWHCLSVCVCVNVDGQFFQNLPRKSAAFKRCVQLELYVFIAFISLQEEFASFDSVQLS